MKAADIAAIVVFVLLAAGGAGAVYYYQQQAAREEAVAYEVALNAAIDRKIGVVNLGFLQPELAMHGDAQLEALQALYADPVRNGQINLGFGTLRGDFRASYERVADQYGRNVDPGRFEAEIDERYGAGAYALMAANYDAFLSSDRVSGIRAALEPREIGEDEARAVDAYVREHGRLPDGPFTIENGRVVE